VNALVSWPVAVACARERIRSGPLWALAAMMALAGWTSDPAAAGADLFGWGTLKLFGAISLMLFTLFLGAGLVSDELESGHAQLVLLRPVTRAAWFGGRLAGAGLVLAAAMSLCWLLSIASALRVGAGLQPVRLLALPVGFAFAFAWVATLAALSVVVRGWSNAGWVILGMFGIGMLFATVKATSAIRGAMKQDAGLADLLSQAISTGLPYIGPQDPTRVLVALSTHQPVDLAPLLYDLFWAAAAWLAGVLLLSRRELARRRS
jgi:ABC-type transport system involved in multi-copper enzyme maturation permease subunit